MFKRVEVASVESCKIICSVATLKFEAFLLLRVTVSAHTHSQLPQHQHCAAARPLVTFTRTYFYRSRWMADVAAALSISPLPRGRPVPPHLRSDDDP
jgi:hypothetical protein